MTAISALKQSFLKLRSSTSFRARSIPFALAVICLLAFGLLIPFLGLYLDDWHHVYFGFNRGLSGLRELFLYDSRPYAFYFYAAGFKLLGFSALPWQIFSLVLRFLAVVLFWFCFRALWPDHEREAAWVAILFAVYPLFQQQQLSIAYSLHWFGYSLYAFSLWMMVLSVKRPERFWLFTVLSLAASLLHLFFLEYFAGIELIRPVILWLLLRRQEQPVKRRLGKTIQVWLPYFIVLLGYALFRLFLLPKPTPGYERNKLVVISDFFKAPLQTAVLFIQHAIQDTLAILVSSWNNALNPQLFALSQPNTLRILLVAILAVAGLFFYLRKLQVNGSGEAQPAGEWYREGLLVGILLTILGILPIWLTDQWITVDNPLFSDRYGLASLIGASLTIVSLLAALVASERRRTLVFSVLIGLSIGWNLWIANDYRLSWNKQSLFFNELSWRAPYLKPGTSLLSEGEIFSRMTEIETSFAVSTLYPKTNSAFALDYFFFSLSRRFADKMDDFVKGIPLRYNAYYTVFNGQSQDSLVISFEPEQNQCLWVLGPEDQDITVLPELTKQAVQVSDLSRIVPDSPDSRPIPTQIFGQGEGKNWCYYYEKADLARQFKDWKTVLSLWKEAAGKGFTPGNGVEYIPFIEGFARHADWKTAEDMTYRAKEGTHYFSRHLCAVWSGIQADTQPSAERDAALQRINQKLECGG
ncbi:MAG TPA: hypothetical protein VF823_02980 [Anaerolineales bacterium]